MGEKDRDWCFVVLCGFGLVVMFVLVLFATALAESEAVRNGIGSSIPTNLSEWFTDVATLGLVIVGLTALVRKHVWPDLEGPLVPAFAILLGVALGIVGEAVELLNLGFPSAIAFGASAGLAASAEVAGLRTILGSDNGKK